MRRILAAALFLFAFPPVQSEAACVCRCVDGEMQPLCQSTLDLPPICPPSICPIMTPSIAPIDLPTIPPHWDNAVPASERVQYIWKLPMAAGL